MLKLILGLVLLISLSACGYHLRGSLDVPEGLKNIYLLGATSSLQNEMASMLRASKAKFASSAEDAGVVIKILKEDIKTRVLSIGATGKSTESEVDYYLRFQVFDNHNQALMDEQTIELAREFYNDQNAVLARSNEENTIRAEIYKQATRMIMARAKIALDGQKL